MKWNLKLHFANEESYKVIGTLFCIAKFRLSYILFEISNDFEISNADFVSIASSLSTW